jgi:imidazolonepropionase-like amidohydrolase
MLRNGRIEWIGPQNELIVPEGMRVIDARGRYLSPGLIEMHAHTLTTSADYLTQIGAGVTTIREMDGFPWLLKRKHQAEAGTLFAPTMFVTGMILNGSDFGGYARAVNTPAEARQAVREQAAQGYDAIKIHNFLDSETFNAIMAEARLVGLDVVGHNPQPVSVAHVMKSGMRTVEHLKGYIDDGTLTISTEDWVTPGIGVDIYLAPTFMAYREHLRDTDALKIVNGAEGYLVHPRTRLRWRTAAGREVDRVTELRQNILPMQKEIFEKLRPHDMKWIAGTDSGSYNNFVPGPALIQEIEMFESLGLSPLEALKTATTNAAEAMRWSDHVGRIEPGLQADLILLDENPLESTSNLRSIRSVVLRGQWIEDAEALLRKPSDVWVQSMTPDTKPVKAEVAAHLEKRKTLKARGYAFNHLQLMELADLIEGFGYGDLAIQVAALKPD